MHIRPVLDLLTLLLLVCATQAKFVNRSIDDTYGDNVTLQVPVYQPNGPWNGANCSGCAINPSPSLAFDGTWSAATYNPGLKNINITFSFTGVAIWVFFILPSITTYATTNMDCNFTLDGVLVHTYYSPQPDEIFHYNVTAYSTDDLSNGQHTMVISANDYPINVYLNFDYAIYTTDEPNNTTSSTSGPSSTSSSIAGTSGSAAAHKSSAINLNKVGIIVGCVLGGLALVVLFAILVLFRRSRMKRKQPIEPIVDSFNQQPPQDYRDDEMSGLHLPGGSAPLVPVRREYQLPQAPNTKDRGREELRALRQMKIDMRLQTVRREMQNLTSRQTTQNEPGSSSREVGREGSGGEMEAIHEQIRQLRTQISQLQIERSSDWAQGLTDAPPPPYY